MGTMRELWTQASRPLVMGILNVTPDSFYAGSRVPEPKAAIAAGLDMVQRGADIVDVGGESTRPGSDPVDPDEELQRVLPVIQGLAGAVDVPISVDTRRAAVAEAALAAGASIVNDVSAGRDDEAMFATVADADADIVLVHMQGTPRDMQRDPRYDDVVGEVAGFLVKRASSATWAGIERDRITIDPGIGFGKRLEHNLALLGNLGPLVGLGYPVLIGVSRKSMFDHLLGQSPEQRLAASLAVGTVAAQAGVAALRVHDVAETADVVRVASAIQGARR